MDEFKIKLNKFLYSNYYLLALAIFTLISWQFKLDNFTFYILMLVILLEFIFLKDAMPTVAALFSGLFLLSNTTMHADTIPIHLYVAPIVLIGGMLFHIIKNKQKFFQGKMLLSMLIMLAAMGFSTFNSDIINFNLLFFSVIGITYFFIYFTYLGSIKTDHKEYLMRMFFCFGLVISFEVLLFFINSPDALFDLFHKEIALGWGISNSIATYLIMFIPASAYFIKNYKLKLLFILALVFQMAMLALTLSRGGILSFILIFPLILLYLCHKEKRKNVLIFFGILLVLFVSSYFIFQDAFDTVILSLKTIGFDDTGRFLLWREAWDIFLANPLFGKGIFARFTDTYQMFHNTFLHTLATLGILGFIGLILQLIVQFGILLKDRKSISYVFLISLLGVHIHGMLDNIYYMPQFMILIMILVAVYEKADKKEVIDEAVFE